MKVMKLEYILLVNPWECMLKCFQQALYMVEVVNLLLFY